MIGESIVFSIGGSLLYAGGKADANAVKKIAASLLSKARKQRVAACVGGGAFSKEVAGAVRSVGGSEFLADKAAVKATHANAIVLTAALNALGGTAGGNGRGLGVVSSSVKAVFCESFSDAAIAFAAGCIPVMGGTIEGITTDADAVLLAEAIGARKVVNASAVGGVYDSNPKTNSGAKLFARLSYDQLVALAAKSDSRKARTNFVFDLVASKLAARSRVEVEFVKGIDFKKVETRVKD